MVQTEQQSGRRLFPDAVRLKICFRKLCQNGVRVTAVHLRSDCVSNLTW